MLTLLTDFSLIIFALLLVLLNGFFVAAEFAMVKLRGTRVEAIARKSGWRGRILRTVHSKLDAYLSACQLGITLASLGLGWIGEPAFAHLLEPLLRSMGIDSPELLHGLAFFTAFFVISYLHIVVGELAPKSWAIRNPELLSLWTAVPLYLFYWLMYPAIYLLNASANAMLRAAGLGEPGSHHERHYSHDELKLILHSSRADASKDPDMRRLASAVELSELEAVDWANSRKDLVAVDRDVSRAGLLELIRRHQYSRYPVFDREQDAFIGLLHIKDVLMDIADQAAQPDAFSLEALIRPIERVPMNMPLGRLLDRFRRGGSHFALVEEGNHAVIGFLTMEDVLEVLVGDIQDEHHKVERGLIVYQPGKLLVRGDTPLYKIERLLGVALDPVEAGTLAGLVFDHLERIPAEEDVVDVGGLRITMKKMNGPQILLAKVVKRHDTATTVLTQQDRL